MCPGLRAAQQEHLELTLVSEGSRCCRGRGSGDRLLAIQSRAHASSNDRNRFGRARLSLEVELLHAATGAVNQSKW